MNRVCSGCGLMRCDGECYHASPSDFADEPIAEPREPYVPDPGYLKWCEEVDLRRKVAEELRFTIEQKRDAA